MTDAGARRSGSPEFSHDALGQVRRQRDRSFLIDDGIKAASADGTTSDRKVVFLHRMVKPD